MAHEAADAPEATAAVEEAVRRSTDLAKKSCAEVARMRTFLEVPITYKGWSKGSHNHAISVQPLGGDHAPIPQMKAMDVPFHLIYGSLICVTGKIKRHVCRPKVDTKI